METTSPLSKVLLRLEAEVCPIALEIEQSTSFSLSNDSSLGLMKTVPQRPTTSFHFDFASPQKTRCSIVPTAASVPFTLEVFNAMHCFFLFNAMDYLCFSYCERFTAFHTTSQARPSSNIEANYLHQSSGQRNR